MIERRRREASRVEERPIGWAEEQAPDVNMGLDLVVTVDTSEGAIEDHARRVLTTLTEIAYA